MVDKNTIACTINSLINNPKEYKELQENALKIRIDNTLDKYYNIIATTPTADYSGITFSDNKKTVIKNVHNKRKQAIKEQKKKSHK